MSAEEEIRDLLAADATIAADATGGVYAYGALTSQAFDRNDYPEAYDANGFALPRVVVKARTRHPEGSLNDEQAQYASTTQVIEVWVYDDASIGYGTIETLTDRCYTLLQGQRIPGAFKMRWINELRAQDPDLNNAPFIRSDYQVIGYRQS